MFIFPDSNSRNNLRNKEMRDWLAWSMEKLHVEEMQRLEQQLLSYLNQGFTIEQLGIAQMRNGTRQVILTEDIYG